MAFLNQIFMSPRDLSNKIKAIVRRSFAQLTTSGTVGSNFKNNLQDATMFSSSPVMTPTYDPASNGQVRYFYMGSSQMGGSHIVGE